MLTKQNTKKNAEGGAKNNKEETIDKATIFYRTEYKIYYRKSLYLYL